jgi:hypothetical protein
MEGKVDAKAIWAGRSCKEFYGDNRGNGMIFLKKKLNFSQNLSDDTQHARSSYHSVHL